MRFTSTRNKSVNVSFAEAIKKCFPEDGGLYVPCDTEDLRRWMLFMDQDTPFSSIAGSITNAFLMNEFSPIICETMATRAFTFSPELKQLETNLFYMDLSTGPTGNHRDFGISFLTAALDTINQYSGQSSIILDVTKGEMGASLVNAIRDKKFVKAVLVFPKGSVKGIQEDDLIWNGGNVYPIEYDGTIEECRDVVRSIFNDKAFVEEKNLNVANTSNIGRLLPQAFFYPFAFSRIKSIVHSDIKYAMAPGNYSNVVAGLYAWQFALPLNGFVVPATDALGLDLKGNPILLDSIVPKEKRELPNPVNPSNIERLEDVFSANELMMRHFIYPCDINDAEIDFAAKELYKKYKLLVDRHTARAYAAVLYRKKTFDDEAAFVLINRDHPSLSQDFIRQTIGENPEMPQSVSLAQFKLELNRPVIKSEQELKSILINL